MAGLVPGYDKPGQQVDEDAELSVVRGPAYVSRGGEKLAHALDELGVDPAGLDVLDVGASTGGFTDVLLQRGAARVIAVDVGYGQLHPKIRDDPRVVVLERTNARALTELPFAPQLVVCDVSFISVRTACRRLCCSRLPTGRRVVLVKPQFEAGRVGRREGQRRRPRPGDPRPRAARGRLRGAGLEGRGGRRRRLRATGSQGQPGVLPPPQTQRRPEASG